MRLTVEAWLIFGVIALVLILTGSYAGSWLDRKNKLFGSIAGGIGGLMLSIVVLLGINYIERYFSNTASGVRAIKTQQSNFGQGINRKVTVYDMEGDVIQEYEGNFDIEYHGDRILFDDEKGLRHIICCPTGTVIIDELNK